MTWTKKTKLTLIMTSQTKRSNPKLPNVFLLETRRLSASLEGLNSSLAQSADELWLETSWTIYRHLRSLKSFKQLHKINSVQCLFQDLASNIFLLRRRQDFDKQT